MSVFFDMFVPSRRYLDEERNRLEWTREEDGLGDPFRGPVDLDGGVVKIKPGGGLEDAGGPEGSGGAGDDVSGSEPAEP